MSSQFCFFGGGPIPMILMFRQLPVVVLHAQAGLGMLIHRPDNCGAVVVTNPRLPLTRRGGYWGSGIVCRAIVARLSSLPRGVFSPAPVFRFFTRTSEKDRRFCGSFGQRSWVAARVSLSWGGSLVQVYRVASIFLQLKCLDHPKQAQGAGAHRPGDDRPPARRGDAESACVERSPTRPHF